MKKMIYNKTNDEKADAKSACCFLKISIGGEPLKEIVIELDICNRPKTCRSFLALCTSSIRTTRRSPQQTYRGSEFHRIIPGMCVQGGDFEKFNGTGGYSVLYGRNWKDEELQISNNSKKNSNNSININRHLEGTISMANAGKPNSNGSQFFITVKPTPHLDANHVVFGRIISGMNTVRKMVDVERDNNNCPVSLQRIVIDDCGQLQQSSPLPILMKEKKKKKKRKKDDDNDTISVNYSYNDEDKKKFDDRRQGSRKRQKKKKESKRKSKKKHDRNHRENSDIDEENSSYNDDNCSRRRRHDSKKKQERKRRRRYHEDNNSSDDDYSSSSNTTTTTTRTRSSRYNSGRNQHKK